MVTNNRCIAEQIKSDKVKNVVMDGSKVGKFGKIERQQNLKSWMDQKLENLEKLVGNKN